VPPVPLSKLPAARPALTVPAAGLQRVAAGVVGDVGGAEQVAVERAVAGAAARVEVPADLRAADEQPAAALQVVP
jgi:hypothetical protein